MRSFHGTTVRLATAIALSLSISISSARDARADARACSAAAEEGQRARAAGQLRLAREKFTACWSEECPALVRQDCQQWGFAVADMMPSIIVDARDANEHDIGDVTVTMDGQVLVTKLDGKAIDVDPGPHTFVFEHAGSPPVTESVIIKERARGRTFVVKFNRAPSTSPPLAAKDAPAAEKAPRGHSVWPWVVVGTGGAMVVTGLIVLLTRPAVPATCLEASQKCAKDPTLPNRQQQDDQLEKDQDQAGRSTALKEVGLVTIIGGAGVMGAGLLWHLLEPSGSPKTARFAPWTTGDAGGLSASGRF